MKKPPFLRTLIDRTADDRGTAMIEFVLLAPVLSYMLIAVLFMQNHIDYIQDSSFRFREMAWKNVLPAQAKNITDGKKSDQDGFFTLPLRTAMTAAMGFGAADGNAGAALAALQVGQVFYENYALKTSNYKDNYDTKATFPDGGWGTVLGSLGTFFAAQIGTGTFKEVEGVKSGWEDRYPYIVEPWMRQYSEKWDPCKFPLVGLVMEIELRIMTLDRTPVPRVDTRDDRNISEDDLDTDRYSLLVLPCFGEDAPDTLKLEQLSGKSEVQKAIQ